MTTTIDTTTHTIHNSHTIHTAATTHTAQCSTPNRTVTRLPIDSYRLPRRFDVHQVERVTTELSALDGSDNRLVLDGNDVEMIDLSALAALTELAKGNTDLRFVSPSVALRATITYTGHDLLSARCTVAPLNVAA